MAPLRSDEEQAVLDVLARWSGRTTTDVLRAAMMEKAAREGHLAIATS